MLFGYFAGKAFKFNNNQDVKKDLRLKAKDNDMNLVLKESLRTRTTARTGCLVSSVTFPFIRKHISVIRLENT